MKGGLIFSIRDHFRGVFLSRWLLIIAGKDICKFKYQNPNYKARQNSKFQIIVLAVSF